MMRIRLHARGGQGIKTASRILGTAFFLEGYEVQDAPRYGAERRGAPIFAYVRVSKSTINERGIISRPDLVMVADESLLFLPSAGALIGTSEHTVVLIITDKPVSSWKEQLKFKGPVVTIGNDAATGKEGGLPQVGAACAGAGARLSGMISKKNLEDALIDQLKHLSQSVLDKNLRKALEVYEGMGPYAGWVHESEEPSAASYEKPHWIDVPFDNAWTSAPFIHSGATSLAMLTGAWRSTRPLIDLDLCHRCGLCRIFCPDDVISADSQGYPSIDYDHCKGCMICLVQCPAHAIKSLPERATAAEK